MKSFQDNNGLEVTYPGLMGILEEEMSMENHSFKVLAKGLVIHRKKHIRIL